MATYLGCKQIYPGKFIPEDFLKLLRKEKRPDQGGYMAGVATMLSMIINHSDAEQSRDHFKGLIYEAGGMRLNTVLAKKAQDLGMDVCSGWGMTEVYTKVGLQYLKPHMFDWPDEKKIEFLSGTGMPPPFVDKHIVDKEGKEVPKDGKTVGEIVLRAPWITSGYYREPEKSKELWRHNWMHSGDMATIDEEGSALIIDRSKDAIKSGGEWISSLTLENLISMHSKVQEVAVFGTQSEEWGERPVALIVPVSEDKGDIGEEKLKEHLRQFVDAGKILKWWIPDKFIFVNEIPRTSVGKLNKKVMRSQYGRVMEEES